MQKRLLVIDRDSRYAEWLRRHLGVLCPNAHISVLDADEFAQRADALSYAECELLLMVSGFGSSPEDPQSIGLERLRRFRARSNSPAIIAIAEEGNELTAVRAIQLGALDYIPKRVLTPERLATSVKLALHRVEQHIERRVARRADGRAANGETPSVEQTLNESSIALPGDFIPGYTLIALLGESEKAVVYRATSHLLAHDIALKIAKTERSEGQLLAREYAAASSLRHAAIVEIYDYGTHAEREYLAMELFPRGDLKARLQLGVTEAQALRYLERIANALRVVHGAGLLHRDLKPPNVMLRESDEVALIDFGLARNLEGGLSTRTGVLRGSPYYMSPEQALGEPLDPRTDLYSLGIIFYEMLTGRKPFVGTSAIEVLQEHVNAPVPQLPATFAHHQGLLGRLLAKSRDERFSTAQELLENLAAGEEIAEEFTAA